MVEIGCRLHRPVVPHNSCPFQQLGLENEAKSTARDCFDKLTSKCFYTIWLAKKQNVVHQLQLTINSSYKCCILNMVKSQRTEMPSNQKQQKQSDRDLYQITVILILHHAGLLTQLIVSPTYTNVQNTEPYFK